MWHCAVTWKIIFLLLLSANLSLQAKKKKSSVLTDVNDYQDFKRVLKSRNNVLVLYINNPKDAYRIGEVFRESSEIMKGQATLISVVCRNRDSSEHRITLLQASTSLKRSYLHFSDSKKLCKMVKIPNEKPYYLKHYKDGSFQKDYDRAETVSAMVNFLRDPAGELPWEEDPAAADVQHLADEEALNKFIKKGAAAMKKAMIMFYAPWCTYCKLLKPEYVKVAVELKGEALIGAIDLAKPANGKLRSLYNITGFPTLLFYENGKFRQTYNGENTQKDIVSYIRNPDEFMEKKEKMLAKRKWSEDTDVVHLTAENFESVLSKVEHALVVFYAPWCGHCQNIKPEVEKAATEIKKQEVDALIGAVDATIQTDLAAEYKVKGYPTLKYFNRGKYMYDVPDLRKQDKIVNFLKGPKEQSSTPEQTEEWAEGTPVRQLNAALFKDTLRGYKHALIMFHGADCSSCKITKSEFVKAAESLIDDVSVMFGAVDCDKDLNLCTNYDVKTYPTISYFSNSEFVDTYADKKQSKDLVKYVHSKTQNKAQQAGFGVNVVLSSDADFETIVSSDKPTFVMFYASWCGHCSTVKPAFSRLATTMLTDKTVQVIAVDAAENPKVADLAKIQTLPTFKMFASGKEIAVYEGDRSYDDMLKFCAPSGKVKEEL